MLWSPLTQSMEGHSPSALLSEHSSWPGFISWPFGSRWKLTCSLYWQSTLEAKRLRTRENDRGSLVWGGSEGTDLSFWKGCKVQRLVLCGPSIRLKALGKRRCKRCPKMKWAALGGAGVPITGRVQAETTKFVTEILTTDGGSTGEPSRLILSPNIDWAPLVQATCWVLEI